MFCVWSDDFQTPQISELAPCDRVGVARTHSLTDRCEVQSESLSRWSVNALCSSWKMCCHCSLSPFSSAITNIFYILCFLLNTIFTVTVYGNHLHLDSKISWKCKREKKSLSYDVFFSAVWVDDGFVALFAHSFLDVERLWKFVHLLAAC